MTQMDDVQQADTPAEEVKLMDSRSSELVGRSAGTTGRKLILTFLGSAVLGFVAVSASSGNRGLEAAGTDSLLRAGEERGRCIWTELPQYDFPDRADSDQVDMVARNWTGIQEVQEVVEDGFYSGFALKDGIAYLKSAGPMGPKSPDDLLWMGSTFDVVFHLCQRPEQLAAIAKAKASTEMLVSEMFDNALARNEGNWVLVDGLPLNEGEGIEIVNAKTATTTQEMRVLCYDDPGCVAFAYFPEYNGWFPKRKGTGFSSKTARYHRKSGEKWEWHYLKSRAGPSGQPEDETEVRFLAKPQQK